MLGFILKVIICVLIEGITGFPIFKAFLVITLLKLLSRGGKII